MVVLFSFVLFFSHLFFMFKKHLSILVDRKRNLQLLGRVILSFMGFPDSQEDEIKELVDKYE